MPGLTSQPHSTQRSVLEALRDRPADFQRLILGRTLWSKQLEVCDAIARSPITVVPAGRAVGKSYLLAGIVLWWLYTRRDSLVITTGPDHRQVVSVLWKEIRRAISRALVPLGHDHLSEGYGSPQRLCVRDGTDWGVLGFAARLKEGFSGQHAADLLVIVDEASGITADIWEAVHGLAATRLVIAGNPIRYDCHFRELHDLLPGADARDPRRAVALVAVEHPGPVPHRGIGAVHPAGLARCVCERERDE
jgi:hypothetical protein